MEDFREGRPMPRQKLNSEEVVTLKTLKQKGQSNVQIAMTLGVALFTIIGGGTTIGIVIHRLRLDERRDRIDSSREGAMKTVRNKTRRPLRVHLARGKTIHLGPLKEGQISVHDVETGRVQRLVEAGELEIVGEGTQAVDAAAPSVSAPTDTHGHHPATSAPKRGDDAAETKNANPHHCRVRRRFS